MNNTPTVSIIVPVYNAEVYLEQCVESIIGQTYQNIEVILVDGGSTDRSGTICDSYAEQDKRVTVIHQENQGLVNTWIRGTRESNGDYLCYVDSDDWIETDMIEVLLSQTTGNPKEMICSNISCDFPEKGCRPLDLVKLNFFGSWAFFLAIWLGAWEDSKSKGVHNVGASKPLHCDPCNLGYSLFQRNKRMAKT